MKHDKFVEGVYCKIAQKGNFTGIHYMQPSLTLYDVELQPIHSDVIVNEVDLSVQCGPIELHFPLASAAMDTVSGAEMDIVLSELGGCGVTFRHEKPEVQLEWIARALKSKPALVTKPMCLGPGDTLRDAYRIDKSHGFSTIPVTTKLGVLEGILFMRDIPQQKDGESVTKWMKPLGDLKTANSRSEFSKIKERLLNENRCSALPVVDNKRRLRGIYFLKDCQVTNPAVYNGKPLVGMAVGVSEADLERVQEGLRLGVGMIVIDSSHGNSTNVIKQTERVFRIAKDKAAIIAGNVASIDGYYRLALAGADGVKVGIGSGSICTTSSVTGVGAPMLTCLERISFMRDEMREAAMPTPSIIPDGGIDGPGKMVLALAAGGDFCMAGEWLVAAKESHSFQQRGAPNGMVFYKGMASPLSIEDRSSVRYGKNKTAAEGIEGWVPYKGPMKTWMPKDIELVKGGFAHVGASNIQELHEFGRWPFAFNVFTAIGQNQIHTHVESISC